MDIPGLSVRMDDSVVRLEARPIANGLLELFFGRDLIIWVNALEESVESRR
jgi:hypothetical protein